MRNPEVYRKYGFNRTEEFTWEWDKRRYTCSHISVMALANSNVAKRQVHIWQRAHVENARGDIFRSFFLFLSFFLLRCFFSPEVFYVRNAIESESARNILARKTTILTLDLSPIVCIKFYKFSVYCTCVCVLLVERLAVLLHYVDRRRFVGIDIDRSTRRSHLSSFAVAQKSSAPEHIFFLCSSSLSYSSNQVREGENFSNVVLLRSIFWIRVSSFFLLALLADTYDNGT